MIKHLPMLLVVGVIAAIAVQTASAAGSLDPAVHWAVEADVGTIQQATTTPMGQRMLVQAVILTDGRTKVQITAKQATTVGTRCTADIPPAAIMTTTNVAGVGTAGTSPPSATTSSVSPPTFLVASGATLLATETQEVARNAIMLSASAVTRTKTIVAAALPSRAQIGAAKTVSGVEATTGTMGQIATHQSFYVCGAAVDKEESTTHGTLRV